jgi:hypothetical protein
MPTSSLSGAIAGIQDLVLTISGIKAAPDNPPESINQFPFAVTYPGEVTADPEAGWYDGKFTIVTEIHWTRQNLPTAVAQSIDAWNSFVLKICNDLTLGGNTLGVDEIRGKFGFLQWADQKEAHIGWHFEIDVQITEHYT